MRSGIVRWHLCVALAAIGCGEGAKVSEPPTPTPRATPLGTFGIVSASPAFGGTVSGLESDLQGTSSLAVTFQMTYTQPVSDVYFVLEALSGSLECLRTQVAYCQPNGGPPRSYPAFSTVTYRCDFFVRDNQQLSCGSRFTTDRVRFVLQDRTLIDPATNQLRTLFTQDASGGWTFTFAR
jgi:hypothetical protein